MGHGPKPTMTVLKSMKHKRRLIFLAVRIFHRAFFICAMVVLVSVNDFAAFFELYIDLFEVYCVTCLV